jgi:uncharacterized membrane protein required for colicin V production
MKPKEGTAMLYLADSTLSFNSSDTTMLIILAVLVAIGLIFGASQTAGKIIAAVAAAFLAPFFANMIMPTLSTTSLYSTMMGWFGGNETLGNWVIFIILIIIIGAVISLVMWLLIKLFKAHPFTNRIMGIILAIAMWAIILVGASFVFSFIGKNLGTSTPQWISDASNTLSSSLIVGKMIEWMQQLWVLLGLAK